MHQTSARANSILLIIHWWYQRVTHFAHPHSCTNDVGTTHTHFIIISVQIIMNLIRIWFLVLHVKVIGWLLLLHLFCLNQLMFLPFIPKAIDEIIVNLFSNQYY